MAKKKRNRFKSQQGNHSHAGISADSSPNYDLMPPLFSLERVQQKGYCLSDLCQTDKAAFAQAIFKRRQIPWSDIKKLNKHALGFEKIVKSAIKTPIPPFITDEIEHFLAFRFQGLKPMVGYRQKNIFVVLWFDQNFTLYKH